MTGYANKAIKQKSFEDLKQEALINLVVAAQYARSEFEKACEQEGITLPQFNILRILKGALPKAYPRSEIKKRMIDNSDVTRLIDRLVTSGLVVRVAGDNDKRQSLTTITPAGISVLNNLVPHFSQAHDILTANLDDSELKTLSVLLKKIKS